jgi:hypothetical protein
MNSNVLRKTLWKNLVTTENLIKDAVVDGKWIILVSSDESLNFGFDKTAVLYSSYVYAFKAGGQFVKVIGKYALECLPKASLIIFVEGQPHVELIKLLRGYETPILHVSKTDTILHKIFTHNIGNILRKSIYFDHNDFIEMWFKLVTLNTKCYKSDLTLSRGYIGKIKTKWRNSWYHIIPDRRNSRIFKCLKKHNYKRKA